MKKSLIALAVATLAAAAPSVSMAEDAPAASPVAFNVGVVTDYRYRGISQTRLKPALQGGVDYAGPAGIYLGAWASSIKWVKDLGGKGSVELDVYGGWKGEVGAGLTLDIGALTYQYHDNKLPTSANTTELYTALSFGPATVKYSHALTNLFGNADSKNSFYLEGSAAIDLGDGYSLTPHVGYQSVKNLDVATYTDYSLTGAKDFGNGLVVSLAVIATDADKGFYSAKGKQLGKTGPVLGLKYSF